MTAPRALPPGQAPHLRVRCLSDRALAPFRRWCWTPHLQAGTLGQRLFPAPPPGHSGQGQARTATAGLRGAVPCPPGHQAASRRHARPSSPSAPVTSARAAARTAPDSPAQRGRGAGERAAGFTQQNGVSGRAEAPYLSPRGRAPAPAPAPASSPLGASCRGLGPSSWTPTFCPGSGAVGQTRGAEGRRLEPPLLSTAKLRPPLPAAPVPERGACLIGGHTLRGRGAASLNSSPPTGRPQPSSPLPTRARCGKRRGGLRAPARCPGLPPWAHRAREPARQDRRPSRVPQTSAPERGLELGRGPEP